MESELDALTHRLEYTFRRRELLEEAFRHSSYVNESGDPDIRDNERLEFLGDAVLDLSVSHMLMELFLDAREGELSKLRSMVVNERGLVRVAEMLNLGEYLRLGRGEELTRGRHKPSILANTVEALLGALYLDGGFDRTDRIIRRLFYPLVREMDMEAMGLDYKSLLQEFTQRRYRTRPEYVLMEESGPPHDRTFRMALLLHGRVVAERSGKSKKSAEQHVAREAYTCLMQDEDGP
jgi:ribonuclease III